MHYGYVGFGYVVWRVLFWLAVIWLIVWLVSQNRSQEKSSRQDPLNILKDRYAKGEITKKQYHEMRKDIEK